MTADQVIAELLVRCRRDHMAWIGGDASGYEFTLEGSSIMGAFGGTGTDLAAMVVGQRRGVTQFGDGEGTVELVSAGVSGDLAWLVMIERATVVFSGDTERSRWDLRATELFRLVGDDWIRFHRHADPLVDFHPLPEIQPLLG